MRGKIIVGDKINNDNIEIGIYGDVSAIDGKAIDKCLLTDSIMRGYLTYGSLFFRNIDGPFVISIADYKHSVFYVVRDKLGIHHVYYSYKNGILTWGNTFHDILTHEGFSISPNTDVIHNYLTFRYLCGRNTLFKGIYELLPAHFLVLDMVRGSIEEKVYWNIPYPTSGQYLVDNERNIINRIEDIVLDNIRYCFKYNKSQIGILSSGGIDSSLIIALASKCYKSEINTFFIGFQDYDGDRSRDAQMVAELYNSKHNELYINSELFADGLIKAIKVYEEPLNHPGNVGIAILVDELKNQMNALILGEGVDTIFCGSKTYQLLKYCYIFNPFNQITKMIFNLISPDFIPKHYRRYFSKIRDTFVLTPEQFLIRNLADGDFEEADAILKCDSDLSYLDTMYEIVANTNRHNVMEKNLTLHEHSLFIEGRHSGAIFRPTCNIETYYPFIDERLLAYANIIPFNYKSRGFEGKYIIKKLAERYFPKEFIYKRKEGFGVPLKAFFAEEKGMGRYYDMLTDSRTMNRGIFKKKELKRIVDNYKHEKMQSEAYEKVLWTIINMEIWFRIYIDHKM